MQIRPLEEYMSPSKYDFRNPLMVTGSKCKFNLIWV